MGSAPRIVVSRAAVASQVMKSPGVRALVGREAEKVAARACADMPPDGLSNAPFVALVSEGAVSPKGRVVAANAHADRAQAKRHVLEKSI